MKKVLCAIAIICFLFPSATIAQDNAMQQELMKAGYLLSGASARLNLLRKDISEIRKKNSAVDESNSLENCHLSMLLENIFLVETISVYESTLLNALQSMETGKKIKQYNLHYSRLKKDTLKRLYLNYQSTQYNFASIENKEIIKFADKVTNEMLKVLRAVEREINILQNQIAITP